MKPINVVLVSGGLCMLLGVATGLLGLLLHESTLRSVATWALGIGIGIGFLPLVAAGSHALYVWLRGGDRDRQ